MTKSTQSLNDAIFKNYLKEARWGSLCCKPTPDRITNCKAETHIKTMIRPSLDVVYALPSGVWKYFRSFDILT